jgi:phosphoglycerol transferase MdoB-like AlkP superfamily enzyme
MGTKKTNGNSPSKFFIAISSVGKFLILWLMIMLTISLIELVYNKISHGFTQHFFALLLWSWLFDALFWLKICLYAYPVFTLLYLISGKFTRIVYYIFLVPMVVLQLCLGLYFTTALVPLGGDLYSYSIHDIKQTIGASGVVRPLMLLCLIVLTSLTILLLWVWQKRLNVNRYIIIALPVLLLVAFVADLGAKVREPNLKSEFVDNLILNKTDYFWQSSYKHFNPKKKELDIYADDYIIDYSQSSAGSDVGAGTTPALEPFKYVDPAQYPFLHVDSVNDVLSPFFKKNKTRPNIVIVIVEGLGRAFTNDGAYLGNFTPFIDSLSGKSIYWKNFLSEGGRTFAALPSILGSLPFAKNGFLALGEDMPKHLSLLSLLKYNGYHTSFYYGGDAQFDNMDVFLHRNHIDELNDERTFPSTGYVRLPDPDGFSWGFNDKSLFKRFLVSRDENPDKPQLSVILTVSTHSPFQINEQAKYSKRFEARMDELHFTSLEKEEHRDYKLQYASVLYLDDALRGFFNSYKQRNDYKNTIFIITGDHRMPEIPMSTKIDRYHVPLIIFSPMLTHSAQIAAVSTHFDITPSILAYLHQSYKLKGPTLSTWIGQGLDTNHSFRNVHSYPLMQTKTDLVDYISGLYHLNEDKLFKFDADLGEDEAPNEALTNRLKNSFDEFKRRNEVIITGSHIIPDSLHQHYVLQSRDKARQPAKAAMLKVAANTSN